ncbi:hypothetical protein D9M71_492240 [compost metagenome]
MPSGRARKKGIRQPHSAKLASPTACVIKATVAAPSTKPAIDPKSSQLPIKPRFRSGEYSATKIAAPEYSPPMEKPCTIFTMSKRIGAHKPIVS